KERCLAAGMDGYLSKPIQPHEVWAALAGLEAGGGGEGRSGEGEKEEPSAARGGSFSPPQAGGGSVLDRAEARQRAGGDPRLLGLLARMFLESSPGQLEELRRAAAGGDLLTVKRLGHTLRGTVGIFGARAALAAAEKVERVAREGSAADAEAACAA